MWGFFGDSDSVLALAGSAGSSLGRVVGSRSWLRHLTAAQEDSKGCVIATCFFEKQEKLGWDLIAYVGEFVGSPLWDTDIPYTELVSCFRVASRARKRCIIHKFTSMSSRNAVQRMDTDEDAKLEINLIIMVLLERLITYEASYLNKQTVQD
ncbi:hypothetical protein QJS10_CPB13g01251 [Acorus calamus]|uniref:Uncharacterized protein n=1 Tax=Acorus calamus TaxID=4465 RepID=A0AAV9DJ42_ACOCL|nr:hypothetical protein QJS10_CPB13g01251 [Acorus calamus]